MIPDARTARQSAFSNRRSGEYKMIDEAIYQAIYNGDFQAIVNGKLCNDIIKELEARGYKVSFFTENSLPEDYSLTYTKISW